MQEEIEVKKQLESLQARVKFIREWIAVLLKKIEGISDIAITDNLMQRYELGSKIYDLENEVVHKEYLIKMRENDAKMWENQRQAITKQVNDEMGGVIKDLRTKILAVKETKIADGIIKRFAKGKYDSQEAKIQDYIMGKQLLNAKQ